MSRNQRARRKQKHSKQQRDARLLSPSRSTIWNAACNRADELIDQELWSEAREVLEAVDRSHPGANCVLDRLAEVYDPTNAHETTVSHHRIPRDAHLVYSVGNRAVSAACGATLARLLEIRRTGSPGIETVAEADRRTFDFPRSALVDRAAALRLFE